MQTEDVGEQGLPGRLTESPPLCWLRADVCSQSQERAEVGEGTGADEAKARNL